MSRRLTGTVIIILLLFSVVSGFYLILSQRAERPRVSLRGAIPAKAVGVVEVFGAIQAPQSPGDLFSSDNHTQVIETLQNFRKESRIKAVVLRINSPGGTVGAVQEITAAIEKFRESGKPIIASITDMGASGGYYIASACDMIVANPGSILGSIGVIMMTSDMSGLLEKIGVNIEVVKSGRYKDAGSFHRPFTPEEKEGFQVLIDDAYDQFLIYVSESREIPVDEVRILAQGQVFTGRQALGHNLIDRLGDLSTAHSLAEELAGVEDTSLVRSPVRRWGRFFGLLGRMARIDVTGAARMSGLAYLYRH